MAFVQAVVLIIGEVTLFWGGLALIGWLFYRYSKSIEGTAIVLVVVMSILAAMVM